MVAIVSGNSLGLSLTSLATLAARAQISDKFTLFGTTYRYGWIQPGGGYQLFLPDAYNVVPPSSVLRGTPPWKK